MDNFTKNMSEEDIKFLGWTKSGILARSLKLVKTQQPEKADEITQLEQAVAKYYIDKTREYEEK